MIKVLIVDDERTIREGIFKIIDWDALKIEVVGLAEHGKKALEMIKAKQVDIIITDIRMPLMDGIALLETVKENYPDIHTIIISGYDDFEYAQKAINLGADGYILKPIEPEKLINMLEKTKLIIETKRENQREKLQLNKTVIKSKKAMEEKWFRNLIYGQIDEDGIGVLLDELKSYKKFAVVVVQIDDFYFITQDMDVNQLSLLKQSFFEIIVKNLESNKNTMSFKSSVDEYTICMFGTNAGQLKNQIEDFIKKVRGDLNNENYTVTIGIGRIYNEVKKISNSFSEAMESLNYKFVLGKSKDIYFIETLDESNNKFILTDFSEEELLESIRLCDKEILKTKMNELIQYIDKYKINYFYVQIIVRSVYVKALNILSDISSSIEEVFFEPLEVYEDILKYQTAKEMLIELQNKLIEIIEYINFYNSGKLNIIIQRSKDYINKNYQDPELTLEQVANSVNVSQHYFSVIFKRKTGETFIDYLTKVRLEKAKELLKILSFKIYEISEIVGYNNATYFSSIFKRHIGVSPTEFRNNLLIDTGNTDDN